jgi:anti-anti-sigma factor
VPRRPGLVAADYGEAMRASDSDRSPTTPAGFSVNVDAVAGEEAVIIVEGELDLYASPFVDDRVTALRTEGARRVTIDLAAVTFIDSSGLGVLVKQLKELRAEGGDLVLRSPPAQTLKVLQITGLDGTIPIVP